MGCVSEVKGVVGGVGCGGEGYRVGGDAGYSAGVSGAGVWRVEVCGCGELDVRYRVCRGNEGYGVGGCRIQG